MLMYTRDIARFSKALHLFTHSSLSDARVACGCAPGAQWAVALCTFTSTTPIGLYAVGTDQQGEGKIFCSPLVVFFYLSDVEPCDGDAANDEHACITAVNPCSNFLRAGEPRPAAGMAAGSS